jgi:hypothetical protein
LHGWRCDEALSIKDSAAEVKIIVRDKSTGRIGSVCSSGFSGVTARRQLVVRRGTTVDRRQRVRISNYLFFAIILLSVIGPLLFLHHRRVATILAIWSALWFGWLVYLWAGHPRVLRPSDGAYRRRLLTNVAITALFLALWAFAVSYGDRGIDIAALATWLCSAGYVLHRVVKARNQLEPIDWLLVIIYVGSVTYVVYVGVTRGVVACGLPFAVAMLLWVLLVGRRRVFMPELNGLGGKIRDRISKLREFEKDPSSTDTRPV